jgi:hypothetical protein
MEMSFCCARGDVAAVHKLIERAFEGHGLALDKT